MYIIYIQLEFKFVVKMTSSAHCKLRFSYIVLCIHLKLKFSNFGNRKDVRFQGLTYSLIKEKIYILKKIKLVQCIFCGKLF